MTPNCPKCKHKDVRRSHRTLIDRVLSLTRLYPYRCEDCQHRFYRFAAGRRVSDADRAMG